MLTQVGGNANRPYALGLWHGEVVAVLCRPWPLSAAGSLRVAGSVSITPTKGRCQPCLTRGQAASSHSPQSMACAASWSGTHVVLLTWFLCLLVHVCVPCDVALEQVTFRTC